MKVTLESGATKTVAITSDMVTGYESGTAGVKTLTVSYGGKTSTFAVTVIGQVNSPTVTKIAVNPSTFVSSYNLGKDLDLTNSTITVTLSNGTTQVVNATQLMITGYDKNKNQAQTVTVNYGGQTATFEVKAINETQPTAGDNNALVILGSVFASALAGIRVSKRKKNN